jgi:catechol 2,3-dioxygenase
MSTSGMTGAGGPIDPQLSIDSVHLAVADLPRSIDFYERTLGLPLIKREDEQALLGPDAQRPALRLSEVSDPVPLPVRATGLFHVAWLHPTRAALAATIRRIAAARWPFTGASDHGVSEALYLNDPDGLGIEIYADRPRERWRRSPDGSIAMVTLPLDIDDLLAQWLQEPGEAIDPGSSVGHVHLKVADLPLSEAFYRDALGFEEQAQIPSAAFLSAGGYHHHLGLNSWQSAGAGAAPAQAPGLREMRFRLGRPGLQGLESRIAASAGEAQPGHAEDGSVLVRDPDGQLLSFTAAG